MKMCFFTSLMMILVLLSHRAIACAVCYGNPEHLMSKGLTAGVSLLLATIIFLLVIFASFFVYLRNRMKKFSDEI